MDISNYLREGSELVGVPCRGGPDHHRLRQYRGMGQLHDQAEVRPRPTSPGGVIPQVIAEESAARSSFSYVQNNRYGRILYSLS